MDFISLLLLIILGLIFYYLKEQKSEISAIKHDQTSNYNKLLEIENLLKELNQKQLPSAELKSEAASILNIEEPIIEQIEPTIEPIEPTIEHSSQIDSPVELIEEKTNVFEIEEIEEIIEPIKEFENKTIQPEPEQNLAPTSSSKEFSLHSWFTKFKTDNPDIERFIGENLINKIGALILVLGISFFVKYAIDKEWINEPSRVGIGIFAGAIILGIAHRLRERFVAFSSVLVAWGV